MLAYIVAARNLRTASVEAKCLLQYYCSNVNEHGTFFKSVLDTHFDTALSERFIHKSNAKWKDMGLLSWTQGNSFKHKANVYTIDIAKLKTVSENSIKQHDAEKNKVRQQWAERQRRHRAKT
jgi:hypothetical protein